METGTDFMTVQEYAKRVGLTTQWIYKLCQWGRIPHKRIGGPDGAVRIPRSALDLDVEAPPVEIKNMSELEDQINAGDAAGAAQTAAGEALRRR